MVLIGDGQPISGGLDVPFPFTALLALGVAAEVAAVMGVAYSHRRRKDV